MDPLSITVACVSLTATVAKTSVAVTTFVRAVRSARSDIDGVSRELVSLSTLLELITEDAQDIHVFPETLRKQIFGILANCELVLGQVQRLIAEYDKQSTSNGFKWAWTGSEDVARLRLSLEAHKSALEIALEMVTLSITKQIRHDTTRIKDDTAAIKQDTSEILQEIVRLRAQLPNNQVTLPPLNQTSDLILARYLDDLTSYAESVCWSEDRDTGTEYDDILSTAHAEPMTLKLLAKAPTVRKSSIHSISSNLSGDLHETAPTEHPSDVASIDSSTPPPTCAEPAPPMSTQKVNSVIPNVLSTDTPPVATALDISQVKQPLTERSALPRPETADRASSEEQTTPDIIDDSHLCSIESTNPQEWMSFRPVQHSREGPLTWHRHNETKQLMIMKSYRVVDASRFRPLRAESHKLLAHPHLSILRYMARTSERCLFYMDVSDARTILTHYISTHHYNMSLSLSSRKLDQDWWEHWSRKVSRQIGSALRYCQLHLMSFGPLKSDDVFVTYTADIKLTGFDLIASGDMSHDKNSFMTFTYGAIIWHISCGVLPWLENDNIDRYEHPRSSILARPPCMSQQCFSLVAGLLGNPLPAGRSKLFPLQEALDHPWMNSMNSECLSDYIPQCAPLLGPFDERILCKLTTLGFGVEPNEAQRAPSSIVNSSDYRTAVKAWTQDQERTAAANTRVGIFKSFKLARSEQRRAEFVKQRTSQFPGGFYQVLHIHSPSPLLAVYYLTKENLEREQNQLSSRLDYRYC